MRNFDESCAYLDQIVGRCVREEAFAEAVLSDPEKALKGYQLTPDEMDDFKAIQLRHKQEAAQGWATIRKAMAGSG